MRLEWLRCFNEIVKTNSMTQAAQNLFLSQPAVSKMIHALEKEIGETLFIRSPFGVQLTEQGELFTKFAREVTKAHEAYLLEKNSPSVKRAAIREPLSWPYLRYYCKPFISQSPKK